MVVTSQLIFLTSVHCLLQLHCVCTSVLKRKTYHTCQRRPASKALSRERCSVLCKKKYIFWIVYELQFCCRCVPEGSWLCFHHLYVGPQRKWKEKAAAVWLYIIHDIWTDTVLCPCGNMTNTENSEHILLNWNWNADIFVTVYWYYKCDVLCPL